MKKTLLAIVFICFLLACDDTASDDECSTGDVSCDGTVVIYCQYGKWKIIGDCVEHDKICTITENNYVYCGDPE